MGRPRLSDEEKKLRGTFQKCRAREPLIKFKPITEIPEPIGDMSEVQRDYYDYTCQLLIDRGQMAKHFMFEVQRIAFYCDIYHRTHKEYVEEVVEDEDRKRYFHNTRVYIGIINKAWKQVRDFEDVFGLAPGQILFKDDFIRRRDERII